MSMRRAAIGVACVVLLSAGTGGCEPDSNDVQNEQQERILMQATNAVGMPAITRFSERKMMKMILELRDQMPPTITYFMDMNGHLHKVCDSVGYALDGATQFTNPSYIAGNSTNLVLPQADPNGLFSPPSSEGSWIACLNPTTHDISIVRSEPRMVTSPFPLKQAVD